MTTGAGGADQQAKVSIVGTGRRSSTGWAGRTFRAPRKAGPNIELATTSEMRIACHRPESRP